MIAVFILFALASSSQAAISTADRLSQIRSAVVQVEDDLLTKLSSPSQAKESIRKIQTLVSLQRKERELSQSRLQELTKTTGELTARQELLNSRIAERRKIIYRELIDLKRSLEQRPDGTRLYEKEKLEAPRRRLLSQLVEQNLKEVEAMRADLVDADHLQEEIAKEQAHLSYLIEDLKEQATIMEFNRQLQSDILKRTHQRRTEQLGKYRELKASENQVQRLLGEFNARKELEQSIELERKSKQFFGGVDFAVLRGKLSPPVSGKLVARFGQNFDERLNLKVFKKGIEIAPQANADVVAVAEGRVAFSGELPNYGPVVIIDHGSQYYSLVGQLGERAKQVGDTVKTGDLLGKSTADAKPVYFEIRSRNIAVDPLTWVSKN